MPASARGVPLGVRLAGRRLAPSHQDRPVLQSRGSGSESRRMSRHQTCVLAADAPATLRACSRCNQERRPDDRSGRPGLQLPWHRPSRRRRSGPPTSPRRSSASRPSRPRSCACSPSAAATGSCPKSRIAWCACAPSRPSSLPGLRACPRAYDRERRGPPRRASAPSTRSTYLHFAGFLAARLGRMPEPADLTEASLLDFRAGLEAGGRARATVAKELSASASPRRRPRGRGRRPGGPAGANERRRPQGAAGPDPRGARATARDARPPDPPRAPRSRDHAPARPDRAAARGGLRASIRRSPGAAQPPRPASAGGTRPPGGRADGVGRPRAPSQARARTVG